MAHESWPIIDNVKIIGDSCGYGIGPDLEVTCEEASGYVGSRIQILLNQFKIPES